MGRGDGKESSLLRDLAGLQATNSTASFLEIAFDAVVVFDTDERITSWNPAAEKMFGWTAQEALGKTPTDLFWPADVPLRNENKTQRQARLMQGETLLGELTPCRKDGTSFPAQFTARAIFETNGQVSGYLAVYRDLSDKLQAREKEDQLQQSNRRLNQILASIQDDFYVLNRDWVFVFASRTFTSRIGKEPEDFVGNNIWEMFPQHVGGILYENFHIAMEQRQVRRFEMPGRYTDAWYRMTAFPSEEGITVIGTDISERRKAEEALRMSEQRLQRVIETDAVGVLFFNPDGYVIHANDVFLNMTGYTRDQIERCELSWRKMTPPEWIEISEAQMAQFAQTGRIGPYEKEYFLADGSRRWMLFAGRAVGDGTISEYCIDISERKRTEAALQQSQKTFQELIERAPFGVYVVDSQFRIAHMNASSQTGAFRNVQQVIGRDFAEAIRILWPEETAAAIISTFRHTLETGEPYYSPRFTNPRQDMARVESYEWELQRMTLPDGQHGVICYYYDSTRLREAEAAAHESEERFSKAFHASPIGIHIFRLTNGRSIDANDAFLDLTGYSREELIGHSDAELDLIADREERQGWIQSLLEQDAVQNVEIEIRHKSGKIIHTLFSMVRIELKKETCGLVMAIDITARKRAEMALLENEKQLQQLNESLELKVQEKTTELRNLAADIVLAVQRERHRISHILHDDLQQRIYAILMQLTFLRNELDRVHRAAHSEALDLGKQLEEVLEITRHLSIDLSPPILQDEGLAQAISWLANQMRQRYGLPIEIQANEPYTIPNEELQVLLFNCVRELLFNVVKHAQASQAVVTLEWLDESPPDRGNDDGKGFPIQMEDQQSTLRNKRGGNPAINLWASHAPPSIKSF